MTGYLKTLQRFVLGHVGFGFGFLTEETLLSRRAPIKEALPNTTDQRLTVLILTPQTCQVTHQL